MKIKESEQIAKNIKILLADKEMTQLELADKIGIGSSTMYRLLKGTSDWQMQWAIRASKVFGISLDALFLGKIVPNGEK